MYSAIFLLFLSAFTIYFEYDIAEYLESYTAIYTSVVLQFRYGKAL